MPDAPIFIQGMTQRSGTNYLRDLLCLHPDCRPGGPIWENYLLEWGGLLKRYADVTYRLWDDSWQVEEKFGGRERLYAALGGGLIDLLNQQKSAGESTHLRLVTKSPSVKNLDLFPHFFPDAPLLILIRDGRSVAESTVRTFQRSYEVAIRDWKQAAQTILRFQARVNTGFLMVRYEDLFHNNEPEMRRILAFLKLDAERYDFEAARNLPVRGSSEVIHKGDLHWHAQERPADFDPTQRWRVWSAFRHARFNWIAQNAQVRLGYSCLPQSRLWMPLNIALDALGYPYWITRRFLIGLKQGAFALRLWRNQNKQA